MSPALRWVLIMVAAGAALGWIWLTWRGRDWPDATGPEEYRRLMHARGRWDELV